MNRTDSKHAYRLPIALIASLALLLAACDSDQLTPLSPINAPLSDAAAAIPGADAVPANTMVQFSVAGIDAIDSATGLARWRLHWQLRDDIAATIEAGSQLRITPYAAAKDPKQLPAGETVTVPMDATNTRGELVLPLSDELTSVVLAVALDATADSPSPLWTHGSAPLELPKKLLQAAAEPASSLYPHLVPGSYVSRIKDGRREHRLALRVLDQNCRSVPRIKQREPGANGPGDLTILENDRVDSESSLEVTHGHNEITLYLVIDVSSSIGDDAPQVVDAAQSVTEIFESRGYLVDIRQFSGTVTRLASLEDLRFETGESATAMYYAIDTVLDDIGQRSANSDHNAILVLTDGQDYASRNYYRGALDTSAVYTYLQQRIAEIRDSGLKSLEPNPFGAGLELHTVSVDRYGNQPVDHQRLEELSWEGGGMYTPLADFHEIKPAFDAVSNAILDTYHLTYSSQQRPNDTALSVRIRTQGLEGIHVVRDHGGEMAAPTVACRAGS